MTRIHSFAVQLEDRFTSNASRSRNVLQLPQRTAYARCAMEIAISAAILRLARGQRQHGRTENFPPEYVHAVQSRARGLNRRLSFGY